MKELKVIGRIMLAVAGIILLVAAVPVIMGSVNYLNTNGAWWNFGDEVARNHMFTVLAQGVNALGGVLALVACLMGKKSLLLALYAVIMMIHPVYVVVTGVQGGTITWDWNQILLLVEEFGVPLLYFIGFVLV